ncbi:MAG: Ig-like domain-containing protein [Vicinamibacterales bacterium]
MSSRLAKLLAATAAAALLAVATLAAQSGFFTEQYEGELFGERNLFETPGYPSGVTYVDGTLYIVDGESNAIVAYEGDSTTPQTVELSDQELTPNQIAPATVDVVSDTGTATKTVLLVSDENTDRVLAFELVAGLPQATPLFAMRLEWAASPYDRESESVPVINGMAMSPGIPPNAPAKFRLTEGETSQTLEVVGGAFAAAWAVDFGQGVPGALLVYTDDSTGYTAFDYDVDSGEFVGTPYRSLTDEGRTNEAFGVAFDAAGNLYLVDSYRYTVTAYGADFNPVPLFTFGTPTIGGKTEEFYEPYGVAYWPDPTDSAGGRLFIADAINNRIVGYRPNLAGSTLDPLFAIELPDDPDDGLEPGQPYGVAVDPVTGKVSTSDASGEANRVWVLQTRNLVAYNLHLLDSTGTPVASVCSGQDYSVRFSLTVPRGRPSVLGATPSLTVDGQSISGTNVGPVDLDALETQTYTYSLTAPGTGSEPVVIELPMFADATATVETDVLPRAGVVPVVDCSGLPPTITATPSASKQVSGWTPVFPPVPFTLGLTATAASGQGIIETEYRFTGESDYGFGVTNVPSPGQASPQLVTVTVPEMGISSVQYRARTTKGIWSPEWLDYPVWLVAVGNKQTNEGEAVSFTVGPEQQAGFAYGATALPPQVLFDPQTGLFTGTPPVGTYFVSMTETDIETDESSTWTFRWDVISVNHEPFPIDDEYALDEDGILEVGGIGILANDTDPDGDTMTAQLLEGPSHGTLTLNANGSFTYEPAADFNGTDWFKYRSNDGTTNSVIPAGVTITVNDVNDTPSFALGTAPTVAEDAGPQTMANWVTAISAGPANESAQTVTFLVSNTNTALFAGQPAIAADGTLTFQAAANLSGTALVTVRAQDDGGGTTNTSAPQTFTITVNGVNDAPSFAKGQDQSVTEDAGPQSVGAWATAISAGTGESSQTISFVVLNDNSGLFTVGGQPAVSPTGALTYTPAPNANGSATVTVEAHDDGGTADGGVDTSAPQTFTITVNPANDVPSFAVGAAPTVLEDTGAQALAGWVTAITAGPADEAGQTLTFLLSNSNPAIFAVQPSLSADGTLSYEPAADAFGTSSVTVRLQDNGGTDNGGVDTSAPQQFTITVTGVNDAPSFTAGTVPPVNEDGGAQSIAWASAITAGALESAQTLTFVVTSDNSGLFATQPAVSPTGVLTYATAANAFGNATVTVVLQDNGGTANGGVNQSAPVTFTIAVSGVNDAPVAANDVVTSVGAAPVSITVLANDSDIDGGVLSLDSFTQPTTGGTVTSSGNQLVFTPTPGFAGTVTFSYTVIDGQGGSSTASVTVTITGDVCTGPATALIRKQVTVNSGSLIEGSVHVMTAVDVTFNGGTLVGDLLMLGTPFIQLNGTPTAYAGNTFGTGAVSPTSHRVTINSGTSLGYVISRTDAVALPTVTAPPASAGTRSVTLNNSTESPGDFATLRDLTLNSNVGPIAVPAGTYRTFTANSNTSFVLGVAGATTPSVYNFQSLTLNSGSSLQVVGPVIVTVKNSVAFNGPAGDMAHPEWLTLRVAATGGLALNSGSSLYGYAEVPNGPVTINSGTELVGGLAADKLTMNSNGRLILRPACQTNQAPTMSASDRSDSTGATVSVQMAGSDPDNDSLTYTADGLPPGVSMTSDGLISGTLTTSGVYTVTVTVTDSSDAIGTATFVWTVATPNQSPTAQNDSASAVGAAPVTIAVLSNDTDSDGGTLNLVSYTQPSGGTVTASGDLLVFTPNPGFVGTATFTYVVSDGQGGTATGTVSVTIAAVPSNLPPVCSATVSPGLLWPPNHKKVYLTLSGITDPDGDALSIRFTSILQDEPTNGPGQGSTMQDGGIEYADKKAWVRAERSGTGDGRIYLISYTATDPDGASCTGQVTVGVPHDQSGTPPVLSPGRWNSLTGALVSAPPAPAAVNDSAMVARGDDQNIAVLTNDTAHGLSLTVSIVSQPAKGTVSVNADGTINYDAPSNWSGTTSFTYKVSNGFTTSAPATVTVIVTQSSDDDDDCGDRNHDHGRDNDGRDRDHQRGDHDRCRHGDGDHNYDRDRGHDNERDRDRDRGHNGDRDRDDDRGGEQDNDCGDRNHDHGRDNDNRDRDHRRGDHDRCDHRR